MTVFLGGKRVLLYEDKTPDSNDFFRERPWEGNVNFLHMFLDVKFRL